VTDALRACLLCVPCPRLLCRVNVCGAVVGPWGGEGAGVGGLDLKFKDFVSILRASVSIVHHPLKVERVFAIVGSILNRLLIRQLHRARRGLKISTLGATLPLMDDLFSVPLGYVDPTRDPTMGSPPCRRFRTTLLTTRQVGSFRGGAKIDMIRDTEADLLEALGGRRLGVILFHVPETRNFAR